MVYRQPYKVMQNYNQQQQAVILKGIAQQILSMNVPSFKVVKKLFEEFGIDFEGDLLYSQMYAALKVAVSLSDDSKEVIKHDFNLKDKSDIVHRIAHFALNMDEPGEIKLRLKVMCEK